MEYKFTVFTPTYNRAGLLTELYESLKMQSYKNFEWLIVDDGSVDNTEEAVGNFKKENILNINYIKKENGGKQRAYNTAVENAKGELFICLDSDDRYIPDALEIILKYWEKYQDREDIAGMGYLSVYPDGKIIGSRFPEEEMLSTQFMIYYKYKVTGDKGLMFRTKILKEYRFPEIEGEKFITEAVVYNRISRKYKILYINKEIEIKQYHEGGLTSGYNNLLMNNPKGSALYHNERNFFKMSFKDKILNNAVYYKFSRAAGAGLKKIFLDSKAVFYLILALPAGEYMWRKSGKNTKR
jgi:glycosyltransferase involved in cell wall biosynthesis